MGSGQKLPPPLEFEAEKCVGRTSNPIVLWQVALFFIKIIIRLRVLGEFYLVYAIGGFFLVKWIWARWKERKGMGAKKESSDDNQPPADDDSQYV